MVHMAAPQSKRPLTESLLIWAGMVTGLVGLVCWVMGVGGVIPTLVRFSLIGLEIQTGSVALVVFVMGFAVAIATLLLGQGSPGSGGGVKLKRMRRSPQVSVAQLIRRYKQAKDTHDVETQRELQRELTQLGPEWTPETLDMLVDKLPDDYTLYGFDYERFLPDS
jgi:hypothetical protein